MSGVRGYRFGRVPVSILFASSGVSDRACRLFAILTRRAEVKDLPTPTRAEMAEWCGCSVDSIDRAIAELEQAGVLIAHRRIEGGRKIASEYELVETPQCRTGAALEGRTGAALGSRTGAASKRRVGTVRERKEDGNDASASSGKPKRTQAKPLTPEQLTLAGDLLAYYREQFPSKPLKSVEDRMMGEIRRCVRDGADPVHIRHGLAECAKGSKTPSALQLLVQNAMNGQTGKTSIATGRGKQTVDTDWSDAKPGEFERFKAEGGDPMSPHCRQHFDFWRAVGRVPSWEESNRPDAWDRALAAARHGDRETGELASVFAASFGGVQ